MMRTNISRICLKLNYNPILACNFFHAMDIRQTLKFMRVKWVLCVVPYVRYSNADRFKLLYSVMHFSWS